MSTSETCQCPDPYCPEHRRCVLGHDLIILPDDPLPDDPAFCTDCGHDVMTAPDLPLSAPDDDAPGGAEGT